MPWPQKSVVTKSEHIIHYTTSKNKILLKTNIISMTRENQNIMVFITTVYVKMYRHFYYYCINA